MIECPICLGNMKTDITLLGCLHKYHTLCILEYRKRSDIFLCPMCRSEGEFLTRCNLKYNPDGSVSYKPMKKCLCNIM